jgi:aminopeptidase YwaD
VRTSLKVIFLLLVATPTLAQDSLYTRQVLKYLCSKKCFGRGYVKNGLETAEKFIVAELRKAGTKPFLPSGYTQDFTQSVNTFPGACNVKLNGKKLVPGIDYILDPASAGVKGKFTLQRKDSVTLVATEGGKMVIVEQKKKLTFSVAPNAVPQCVIELNSSRIKEKPHNIALKIGNKVASSFLSRNIIASVEGNAGSDSMVVFTAHYDHLGGMGKKTWFPGANDNASGVSMVLNLARHYASAPSRYKIVFIFFAGEEAGLLGSEFLVKSGILDLKKIKFLINLDLLGTGDDGIMVVNGAIHNAEFDLLARINNEKGLVKEIRKRGKARNSDHFHFSEAGVKAFFIYTLGGTTAYHDVQDVEKDLPLTDYKDVFKLIVEFEKSLH